MFSVYDLHDMIEQATLAYPRLSKGVENRKAIEENMSDELEKMKEALKAAHEKARETRQSALRIPTDKEDNARIIAYELGWDYNNLTDDQLAIVVASL